jgi:hypothetical protein
VGESVQWARELASACMADPLPRRWAHVQAVAAKAETLRPAAGRDGDLLVMAAWLHDIGYAPGIVDTGFHPLDGARHLRGLGADARLCSLVANHSAALREAELRGLSVEMIEFPDEASFPRDAVWYCDMTISPTGEPMSFDMRLAEIRDRYGPDHTVPQAISGSANDIRTAIARVQRRMQAVGAVAD